MGNITPKIAQYKITPISCCVFCGGVHPLYWGKLPMNLRDKEDVACGYWCRAWQHQSPVLSWHVRDWTFRSRNCTGEGRVVSLVLWFQVFTSWSFCIFLWVKENKDIWRRKINRCYFVFSFTDLCHSLFLVFQSSASTLDSNSAWLHSYQLLFSP